MRRRTDERHNDSTDEAEDYEQLGRGSGTRSLHLDIERPRRIASNAGLLERFDSRDRARRAG